MNLVLLLIKDKGKNITCNGANFWAIHFSIYWSDLKNKK